MNIRKLSVPSLLDLLAVSNCGSINRAAQELNMSQSSLTRSIHRLEHNLGVKLLTRTSTGVSLTVFGELLVTHARAIESELRQSLLDLSELTGSSTEQVSIGMSPTIAHRIGPAAVASMLGSQSRVSVSLLEASKPLLRHELLSGRLDMFVAMRRDGEELVGLAVQELFSDELALVARREHPLARRKKAVATRELVDYAWVLPATGTILRQRIEERFTRDGCSLPRKAVNTASIPITKALVLETDRMALMPTHVFHEEIRQALVVRIRSNMSIMAREFAVYTRADEPPSTTRTAFVSALRETIRNVGALKGRHHP